MKRIIRLIVYFFFPPLKKYHKFLKSQTSSVSFKQWCRFWLSKNKKCYWPVNSSSLVTHSQNIYVGINSKLGIQTNNYIQGNGGVFIGDYVTIARNVGIISANHDVYDHSKHYEKEVHIGDFCWIGMNVMIMPGVCLGPRTVVGAGSVVTKSFPDGYCIIGGNPAKLIKELDKDKFVPTKYEEEYYGFVPKEDFQRFAKKHLKDNKYYDFMTNNAEKQQ